MEYYSILPVKGHTEQFAVFVNVANSVDSRDINITVYENDEILFEEVITVLHKIAWFRQVIFDNEKTYTVKYSSYDRHNQTLVESKKIVVDKDYFEYQLPKNGVLALK